MEHRPFRVEPSLLEFARVLRTVQTSAEEKLWKCLRNRRLNGLKFRRQVPIDHYVADFYCADAKVIVELDGEAHEEKQHSDESRTERLESLGYQLIRFTNDEVEKCLPDVLGIIGRVCQGEVDPRLGPSIV